MNTCTNTLRNNVTRWWTQRKSLCSTCHSWSDKWSKLKAVADGKTASIKNEERQTERMQIFWKWRFKENVKNVSLGAGLDCDMLLFFLDIPVSFLSFILPPFSFFFNTQHVLRGQTGLYSQCKGEDKPVCLARTWSAWSKDSPWSSTAQIQRSSCAALTVYSPTPWSCKLASRCTITRRKCLSLNSQRERQHPGVDGAGLSLSLSLSPGQQHEPHTEKKKRWKTERGKRISSYVIPWNHK